MLEDTQYSYSFDQMSQVYKVYKRSGLHNQKLIGYFVFTVPPDNPNINAIIGDMICEHFDTEFYNSIKPIPIPPIPPITTENTDENPPTI